MKNKRIFLYACIGLTLLLAVIAGAETMLDDDETLYTCGMHPEVIQPEPGTCPICGMVLTPVKATMASGGGPAITIDPATLQNIGVVTETVERRDLAREIRLNGVIAVAEEAEVKLNSKVSGWIEKLYVPHTGDSVEKGQPLLEIYSPELVAAQEEYLLALESSASISRSEIDRIQKSGDELLAAAKRRLQLWDIDDEQIEDLEKTRKVKHTMTLTSPASGIVLHKNIVEGAAVKPGMDLFHIADLDTVWVLAQVYEYELPWVSTGDEVEIRSPYDTGFSARGRVDFVYPTLDAKTRTVEIRIVLPNPSLRLKPEMYVDVVVSTMPRQGAVSVSKPAVIRSGTRDVVFVDLGEGRFEPREVHIGLETDRYYEILHGLDPGEEVVTSGQFLLDSEAKLQEAIQRRLKQRKRLIDRGEDVPDEPVTSGHGEHVH